MALSLAAEIQSALGSAYTIEHELGGAGMSRVYVAEETPLGRRVVVKALPADVAEHVDTGRFRREMQYVARLQHPLIVPMLSSGEVDGLLYYTMPFVEGESLQERLRRSAPLAIPETLRILRDVADALSYAHRRHVVHRDIKPANILLSDGHALVTDFGVAKALRPAPDDWQRITGVGVALGTATYMAPEQALGDTDVDHRADIYSFGVLAYEMLTGQPPFSAATTQSLLAAHVRAIPLPPDRLRPDMPPELRRLVMRCLEKDPARRWRSAADLVERIDVLTKAITKPTHSALAIRLDELRTARPRMMQRVALTAGISVGCAILALIVGHLLTERLHLPSWVMVGVAALIVVGVAVVLATTARFAHWLSWRRAIEAGVVAWAIWGIVVAVYMVARGVGAFP
ncbi:MAG TPA: serine/threonine-protein kinase [Gemmatimonadaceae bacterium]